MITTYICCHCGKELPQNPRLKKKHTYCSAPECQQTRRSVRKKERYQNDTVYRKKHLERQQKWREQRPSHQYQRTYREMHPDYVARNRELQSERNKRRQRVPSTMIVNGTSLFTQPSNSVVYAIFKVHNKKIVNGTPFLAHMQILSREQAILVQNSV
jgi:NAD-dependent SIR2 family protein deacetylase